MATSVLILVSTANDSASELLVAPECTIAFYHDTPLITTSSVTRKEYGDPLDWVAPHIPMAMGTILHQPCQE